MDPKDIQRGSSQVRKEHEVEQKRQHESSQRKITCFCANCKVRGEIGRFQTGCVNKPCRSNTSNSECLSTSNTSQKENSKRTSRNISNRRTSQNTRNMIEQDYTIAMPKLLALQAKYGMSDEFSDQLLSLLHNKLMLPGNTCPESIKEARELIAKCSRPS